MNITYPSISKDQNNNFFITFYLCGNRFRLYSSKKIGGHNHPNKFEGEEQLKTAYVLAAEVYSHFKNGGKFHVKNQEKYLSHKDYLKAHSCLLVFFRIQIQDLKLNLSPQLQLIQQSSL